VISRTPLTWCALALLITPGFLLCPLANARKAEKQDLQPPAATLVDGFPALQYSFGKDWTTYISIAEFKGEAAFKFPVRHIRGIGIGSDDGFLYITPSRMAWAPEFGKNNGDQGLEVSRRGGTCNRKGKGFQVKTGNREDWFMAVFGNGEKRNWFPQTSVYSAFKIADQVNTYFASWCADTLTDFNTAQQKFRAAVGDRVWESSPTVKAQRQAEEQAFHQKAAAWRAGGAKVELPQDADDHRILAEAAYKEKNVDRAISHYEAALKIYPTWPEGQFNLALLCGENSDYSCAAGHMQAYLELVPDAPDARAAREKLVVWRDKLANIN
jgi:tetratricopeptide (TPR) repeat protein